MSSSNQVRIRTESNKNLFKEYNKIQLISLFSTISKSNPTYNSRKSLTYKSNSSKLSLNQTPEIIASDREEYFVSKIQNNEFLINEVFIKNNKDYYFEGHFALSDTIQPQYSKSEILCKLEILFNNEYCNNSFNEYNSTILFISGYGGKTDSNLSYVSLATQKIESELFYQEIRHLWNVRKSKEINRNLLIILDSAFSGGWVEENYLNKDWKENNIFIQASCSENDGVCFDFIDYGSVFLYNFIDANRKKIYYKNDISHYGKNNYNDTITTSSEGTISYVSKLEKERIDLSKIQIDLPFPKCTTFNKRYKTELIYSYFKINVLVNDYRDFYEDTNIEDNIINNLSEIKDNIIPLESALKQEITPDDADYNAIKPRAKKLNDNKIWRFFYKGNNLRKAMVSKLFEKYFDIIDKEDDVAPYMTIKHITFLDDESEYFGEINTKNKSNQRHGRGIQVWKNGDKYEGYWYKGHMSFFGILSKHNKDIFEGEFINSVFVSKEDKLNNSMDNKSDYCYNDETEGSSKSIIHLEDPNKNGSMKDLDSILEIDNKLHLNNIDEDRIFHKTYTNPHNKNTDKNAKLVSSVKNNYNNNLKEVWKKQF